MALQAYDGFDNYNAAITNINARSGVLTWTTTSAAFATPGRGGFGTAVVVGPGTTLLGSFETPNGSGFVGMGVKNINPGSLFVTNTTINLMDLHAGPAQLSIALVTTRNGIDVFRGSTLIGQTVNNAINLGVWSYLEIGATIGTGTSGALELRCNGQTILNLSGINTQVTGNAFFDGIQFNGGGTPSDTSLTIDDFYLADTATGPGLFPFNTFAGDVRSVSLQTIGAGTSTAWTPLAGANWQEVSEVHNDGDATYNSTATVGATDLFTFAALAGTISSVLAVQILGSYRKDDAGLREITQQLVSGGTTTGGTAWSVAVDYQYVADLFVLDPNTSANWTTAGVNALQAGYELTT